MTGDSFIARAQALRDGWVERRQVRDLAGAYDFESQYRLLLTLHSWASDGVRDIRDVYGGSVATAIGPSPTLAEPYPEFSLSIADAFTARFVLSERRRMGGSRWFIAVALATAGEDGLPAAASAERRNGQWTRARLEEVLLTVVGAYERAISERDPAVSATATT